MKHRPLVSFVLATHNRSVVVLRTLGRIDACGLSSKDYDIWIVDNASTDGTPDYIRQHRPDVNLLALDHNRGSCAKQVAARHAQGHYLVFLDDDSFPLDDSVLQMVDHFEADEKLGAAGFVTFLPDASQESSALPNVFVGCGVGLRRTALEDVGGLDMSYFMQAEEYDLSFRLIQHGYAVKTFENLYVLHEKTGLARRPGRRMFYDTRNNLVLALNYVPQPYMRYYVQDWCQRYRWIAQDHGADADFQEGCIAGYWRGWCRRLARPTVQLTPAALETLFGLKALQDKMRRLRARGYRRVLFADLGKNIYAYYQAARHADLQILAIMDDAFARVQRTYRQIPILTVQTGLSTRADAIIISNSSPVHARRTQECLQHHAILPIFRWHSHFQPFPPRGRLGDGPVDF